MFAYGGARAIERRVFTVMENALSESAIYTKVNTWMNLQDASLQGKNLSEKSLR